MQAIVRVLIECTAQNGHRTTCFHFKLFRMNSRRMCMKNIPLKLSLNLISSLFVPEIKLHRWMHCFFHFLYFYLMRVTARFYTFVKLMMVTA